MVLTAQKKDATSPESTVEAQQKATGGWARGSSWRCCGAGGRRRHPRGPQCPLRRGGRSHPQRRGTRSTPSGAVPGRWADHAHPDADRHHRAVRHDVRRLLRALAAVSEAPVHPDDDRDHHDRVARPDHELGAVRGLQPAALALAGDWPLVSLVAHGRTVHRVRLRDVLLRCRSSRRCGSCERPGATAGRLVRVAPSAHQPGGAHLRGRLRLRRGPGDLCVRGAAVHLLAGHPVRIGFAGKSYQFPLMWESSLVTMVMIPAGVLVYRDDTGKTQAEKLAQRLRMFRGRPALGTFLVMFAILNVAYFFYGGVRRRSGSAARPHRLRARSRIPRRRCTTRRATTRRADSRARTSRASGRDGNRAAGRTTRCHTSGRRRTLQPDERSQRRRKRLSRRQPIPSCSQTGKTPRRRSRSGSCTGRRP